MAVYPGVFLCAAVNAGSKEGRAVVKGKKRTKKGESVEVIQLNVVQSPCRLKPRIAQRV